MKQHLDLVGSYAGYCGLGVNEAFVHHVNGDLDGCGGSVEVHHHTGREGFAGQAQGIEVDVVQVDVEGRILHLAVADGGIHTALQRKQDALSFDNAPTEGSTNPVTSGGVYAALHDGHEAVSFDDAPVEGSRNAVRSGGLYTALAWKQDDLRRVPTVSSLLDSDYLFLQRGSTIYKIRASAVFTPSGGEGIETEDGVSLLTEDGDEILIDTEEDEPDAVAAQSGEQLLTENSDVITIDH